MSPKFVPPPGEQERLAECAREPIRFPGAVQPHGVLLVVDPGGIVSHASENATRVIGVDAIVLLGNPITALLDDVTMAAIDSALDPESNAGNPVSVTFDEKPFDLIAHRAGEALVLEFEAFEPTAIEMILGTRGPLRRFSRLRTVEQLWGQVATEVRAVTGFDRVMVYHFHPDDHGEIVAESVAEGMEPYLGLHYPASDIPAQARELYVTKLSRQIVSSTEPGVALLADAGRDLPTSIDLSRAELRAVSPHHLEFMRNMGQTSSFSLSLVLNGKLVGMITGAHRTEHRLPFSIRDGLEILASQVTFQIGSMRAIERLERRNTLQEIRAALVAQLTGTNDVIDALLRQHVTLLDLIPADGAAVRLGGRVETIGEVPSHSVLAELEVTTDLVSESLAREHPALAERMPSIAGLMVRRLGTGDDYLAWFRRQQSHTVDWLGDMSLENRRTTLSPRNSFSIWSQEVGGTSEPWLGLERDARELVGDLQASLLHRVQSQLAELALHDPLTGLPNRRLFMDRLQQQLAHTRRTKQLAVVFIDIDHFKAINDEYGHAAGDAALVHIATALTAVARSGDTVARLGGDEFVLLCSNISAEDARGLAERILAAVAAEPAAPARWRLAASAGVTLAGRGANASQVLSAADSAMYRAKAAGRGRVSV